MSTEMTLRPYQAECIEAIIASMRAKNQRQLIALPTGSGKTVVFAALIQRLTRGRALVLAHREELLDQAVAKIRALMPNADIGVDQGKRKAGLNHQIVVASVPTMRGKRLLKWPEDHFTLVIIDEAHHSTAKSYRDIVTHFGVGETPKKGKLLIGVTATPFRGGGKQNLHELFEAITYQKTIRDLVRDGFLSPIRGYSIGTDVSLDGIKTVAGDFDQPELAARVNVDSRNQTILDAVKTIAPRDQTVIFTVSVDHAHTLAQLFDANGIRTEAIWGNMMSQDRSRILKEYANGEIQCLTNVNVLTEGWDCPSVSTIVMACPTKSHVKYMQAVGRGTRIAEGKDFLKILDLDDIITKYSLCHIGVLMGRKGEKPADNQDLLEWDEEEQVKETEKSARTATKLRLETSMIDLVGEDASIFAQSPLAWIELDVDIYYLKVGDRLLIIEKRGEGWFCRGEDAHFTTLGHAISHSDDIAMGIADETSSQLLIQRSARWRKDPASVNQISRLGKYGIEYPIDLTKGQAGTLLTRYFHKKGWLHR